MDGLNVLSLFDGIGCGRIALDRAKVRIKRYFSSEIKKHAIKVMQKNYPDTIQLGDIRDISYDPVLKTLNSQNGSYKVDIDLIIAGSPCQDLSTLKKNGKGLEGEKSSLFYEFYRILEECNPKIFFLENVRMKSKWKKCIDTLLGVRGIGINSNLVSAQNRFRIYWTNIIVSSFPKDKKIKLSNILESNPKILKEFRVKKTPSRDTMWFGGKCKNITNLDKSSCLTTKMDRWNNAGLIEFEDYCRFLTPLECERLQTLPEGYTSGISRNQRYDVIGDGWTIDIISHFFKGIPKSLNLNIRSFKDIDLFEIFGYE